MNQQEEYNHESNINFIPDVNKYSDDQLNSENFKAPNDSKQTVYKEDLNNEKPKNSIITTKNTTNPNSNNTLTGERTLNFITIEPKQEKYKRTDNLRRLAFYIIMIFLRDFFKERFGLDFESFNCGIFLGISICHMKKVLDLQIYQLLCFYEEYKTKIINFIKNSKMNEKEKSIFFYFMTRTYKELYKRFVSGNINFPFNKGQHVRINKFITLKKAIKEKTEKLKKKGKDGKFIENTINSFENLCRNMISDIENGKNEKGPKEKEKEIIPVEIGIFTYMRNHFPIDDYFSIQIELEEEC